MNPVKVGFLGTSTTNMLYEGAQLGYGLGIPPLSAVTATANIAADDSHILLPLPPPPPPPLPQPDMYSSVVINDSPHPPPLLQAPVESESGLIITNNCNILPMIMSRKRRRKYSMNNPPVLPLPSAATVFNNDRTDYSSFSFLGEDLSFQIHQQQIEVDRLISQHMGKVRMEIEERRKRETKKILQAMEEEGIEMVKRLRAKEEEVEKIGKANMALQERIKSLWVEKEIWRDLAQANEATSNALRTSLHQLTNHHHNNNINIDDNEVQSCYGSNFEFDDNNDSSNSSNSNNRSNWVCRRCRKEAASALLLPCRHLCLCTGCASSSSLNCCPVCNSPKTAIFHVNMSTS